MTQHGKVIHHHVASHNAKIGVRLQAIKSLFWIKGIKEPYDSQLLDASQQKLEGPAQRPYGMVGLWAPRLTLRVIRPVAHKPATGSGDPRATGRALLALWGNVLVAISA